MTIPLISGITAALIALLQVGLMMAVGLSRAKAGISLGDGGDAVLLRKIRRHGNLTENAPIFLILLGFIEMSGGPAMAIATLAGLFVVARLAHAVALSEGPAFTRPAGAFGTIASILGAAGALLYTLAASL